MSPELDKPVPQPVVDANGSEIVPLFAALPKLGLRLKRGAVPVNRLIIEAIEKTPKPD